MNNKSQAYVTKSIFVFLIILFYAGILLFYGYAFGDTTSINGQVVEKGGISFGNIMTGISNVPTWINIIIFTPLFIALLFVVIPTFIPTTNGGS